MTFPMKYLSVFAVLLISFSVSNTARADHAWGNYHWGRTTPSFTLLLGDNLTKSWDSYLTTTSMDWSLSSVLNTVITPGNTNNRRGENTPKNCTPTSGRAEVCNSKYGSNGWLGIASVWASGDLIVAGTVKLNDTYFATPTYNTPEWKNLVMCQEVGHIFGLAHQDEVYDNPNLGTCMDYTNSPSSNQHPNSHDYSMLETIYAQLDSLATVSQTATTLAADSNDVNDWGKEAHRSANGHASIFIKEDGNGNRVMRHVYWAEPRGSHHHD